MSKAPDFRVSNHGSVFLIEPMNDEARTWLNDEVVTEGWQWFGGSLGVDPRVVLGLAQALQNAGFVVE